MAHRESDMARLQRMNLSSKAVARKKEKMSLLKDADKRGSLKMADGRSSSDDGRDKSGKRVNVRSKDAPTAAGSKKGSLTEITPSITVCSPAFFVVGKRGRVWQGRGSLAVHQQRCGTPFAGDGRCKKAHLLRLRARSLPPRVSPPPLSPPALSHVPFSSDDDSND